MNTIELAYQYMRGDISEDVIISILGEQQAANIISVSQTFTQADVEALNNKYGNPE